MRRLLERRAHRLLALSVLAYNLTRVMNIVGIKPLVAAPCFYEPTVNRTYAEMAAHYNTAIVPAVGASLLINALVAPKVGGQADARSHHRRAES